jgi:hypothetical protein
MTEFAGKLLPVEGCCMAENRNRPRAGRECIVGPTGASQGSHSAILEVASFPAINRNFSILVPRVTTERHKFTSGRSLANYGRSIAAAVAIAQLLLEGCQASL